MMTAPLISKYPSRPSGPALDAAQRLLDGDELKRSDTLPATDLAAEGSVGASRPRGAGDARRQPLDGAE